MVVADATTLLLLFRPDVAVPNDASGKPISRAKDRVDHLVSTLQQSKTPIIVPTPALAEVLIKTDAETTQRIVDTVTRQAVFRVESFDVRAAIELAVMQRKEHRPGRKKRGLSPEATWAKLKYDRQIVAIAIVAKAERIYSDDGDIRAIATAAGVSVTGLADLPLPPDDQPNLDLFQLMES